MSEEFLRKYEEDEAEVDQTIGEAVPAGEELFKSTGGKRQYNIKSRKQSERQRHS